MKKSFSTAEMMRYMPHRFPFLLIDRILDISDDYTECRALKNVTVNEPQFTGHFPEYPVMPGVLLIEAMAQACGPLVLYRLPDTAGKSVMIALAGTDSVRFRRMVQPGDQVIFNCRFVKARHNLMWFDVKATVDGEPAATATLLCAVREFEQPADPLEEHRKARQAQ